MAIQIQKLLHSDYHDSEIIICDRKITAIGYILYESIKYKVNIKEIIKCINLVGVSCKAHGMYSSHSKRTFIFTFNTRNNIKREKLNPDFFPYFCSYTIMHELRHHFQHKNKRYLDCVEKDAIKFEYRMMDKLWTQVDRILHKN